jgi:hypothetical protein
LLAVAAPAGAQAPGVPPPGANDFACRSAAHPVPVILVHGTFGDMTVSWNLFSPALKIAGYCVFALDLVRRGMAPVDRSADKLAAFIDEVLIRTGAAQVSLVGGGARHVHRLVRPLRRPPRPSRPPRAARLGRGRHRGGQGRHRARAVAAGPALALRRHRDLAPAGPAG